MRLVRTLLPPPGGRGWLAPLFVLLLALGVAPAGAEDEEAAESPAEEPARPDKPPPIHKLYVPFRDLSKIFEKEGEGVFLPYAEFRRLWEAAHRTPAERGEPPVAAVVRAAAYEGRAEGGLLTLEAQIEVEVLAKGWQRVPLAFAGIGVERATVDGAPALLLPTKRGYDLLLEGAGRRTLALTLQAAAPATGDTHAAEFSLPPVPLARLAVRVPGRDTEVEVEPRLAGTRRAAPGEEGATELLAFLGPVSKVRLSWRRKPEDLPTVDPLLFAEETQDVRVDRGVVRSTFSATLSIRRAPLSRFVVLVPEDVVVLYLRGEGIRAWSRNHGGNQVEVLLREPVKEKYAFQLGLEKALAPPPASAVLPLAFLEGMERERGFLRVQAADGVTVEPESFPGWVQVDLPDLPPELGASEPGKASAWRYPSRPGEARVSVRALEPRVSAALGQRVGLRPEGVDLLAQARVTVERAGVFGLDFEVPPGLEVLEVTVAGVEVDDWRVERPAEGPGLLKVGLRDRLLGAATVTITARRPLAVPEEEGRSLEVDVPLLRLLGAAHVRGYLALHRDAALDHSERPGSRTGLTPLDAAAAAAWEPPALPGDAARLPLGGRFEHRDGPIGLTEVLKRKAATLTCAVEQVARLEPDRVRLGVTLRYQVSFRGVDTLRFRAPLDDDLARRLHLDLPGWQLIGPSEEVRPEDAPPGPARGIWTVKLPSPRTGEVVVPLVIDDQPAEALASGQARASALPVFVPLGDRQTPLPNTVWHLAVRRDPQLEVDLTSVAHAEEIDARELPAPMQAPENFLAVRSWQPEHAIEVRATRHHYESVAELVVSHMHLDTALAPEGRAVTEAYLVVRNNDREYLELALPPGSNIRAVQVGGKAESPRVGEGGTVLVPILTGRGKDEAFLVALAYDHEVARSGGLFETVRVVAPHALRAHADLLTWRVFLPSGREVVGFGGSVQPLEPWQSWAARTLEGLTGRLVEAPGGRRLDWRRLMQGFESPFGMRHPDRAFDFQGRAGPGEVSLTTASPTGFLLFRLLFLGLAFAGARGLVRLGRRRGFSAAGLHAGVALVLLALLVPAGQVSGGVFNAMLVGVLASALLSFVGWVATRPRREPPAAPPPPPEGSAPEGPPAAGASPAGPPSGTPAAGDAPAAQGGAA